MSDRSKIEEYLEKSIIITEKIRDALNSDKPWESLYKKDSVYSDLESLSTNLEVEGILRDYIKKGVGTPFDF